MSNAKRESFVFYDSFYNCIKELNPEDAKKLIVAICEYSLEWNEIEVNGVVKIAFWLIKPQLDANNRRYENWCKGWRKVKTWDNSQKPNGNQNITKQEPNGNQSVTKVYPNDNDNDNVNENDNVNDNEKGFGGKQDTQITLDANASRWIVEKKSVVGNEDKYEANGMKLSDKLRELWLEDEIIELAITYNGCKKWKKLDKFKDTQLKIRVDKLRRCWFNTIEWMKQVLENSIAWWYQWIFELKQKPNIKPKSIEEWKVVNVNWANIFF